MKSTNDLVKVESQKMIQEYQTYEKFVEAMQSSGVIEDTELIFAVDCTKSNETFSGEKCFQGHSLHDIRYKNGQTPYSEVMRLSTTIFRRDISGVVPLYYFGSAQANQQGGILYVADCHSLTELQTTYVRTIELQTLSGPTTFVPMIDEALRRVKETGRFHLLIIITDGIIDESIMQDHLNKLDEASNYFLAIACLGVGDGPFTQMQRFDNDVGSTKRVFDNFQFFECKNGFAKEVDKDIEQEFYMRAFGEVPVQYEKIKRKLNYKPLLAQPHVVNQYEYLPAIAPSTPMSHPIY